MWNCAIMLSQFSGVIFDRQGAFKYERGAKRTHNERKRLANHSGGCDKSIATY